MCSYIFANVYVLSKIQCLSKMTVNKEEFVRCSKRDNETEVGLLNPNLLHLIKSYVVRMLVSEIDTLLMTHLSIALESISSGAKVARNTLDLRSVCLRCNLIFDKQRCVLCKKDILKHEHLPSEKMALWSAFIWVESFVFYSNFLRIR